MVTACLVREDITRPVTLCDERLETFGQHQGGAAQLDDLDLTFGDENIEGAAADANVAAGVRHAHGDRLDRKSVPA